MSWRDGGGESGRSERQVVKGSMSWREVVEGSLAVKRHSREKATLTVAVQSSGGRGNRLKNVAYSQDLMKKSITQNSMATMEHFRRYPTRNT